MTTTADVRRARRAYLIVATWIPLGLTLLGAGLMLAWIPDVPSSIAVHWGADGRPDGFGPAWSMPVILASVGVGLALLFALMGWGASRSGEWGPTLRFLGALGGGTSVLITVGMTVSFAMQRGADAYADAPSALVPLLSAFVAGAAAGVLAWFVQPDVTVSGGSVASDPALVPVGDGERVAWLRTTTMSRPAMIAIVGVTLLQAALAVVSAFAGSDLWWLFAALAVVFAVLTAAMCVFRVSVTAAGLRVSSIAGVPRFVVPLADIDAVSVTRVDPAAQFGGWGIRVGVDGRLGIVLHSGEAIQVTRRGGRTLVVTVDDAATGAGLLSALVSRAATRRP
jgi:hypothetical protein